MGKVTETGFELTTSKAAEGKNWLTLERTAADTYDLSWRETWPEPGRPIRGRGDVLLITDGGRGSCRNSHL